MASAWTSLASYPPLPSGLMWGRLAWALCVPLAPVTAPLTTPVTAPVTAPAVLVTTFCAAVITFVPCDGAAALAPEEDGDGVVGTGATAGRVCCAFWAQPTKVVRARTPAQPMQRPRV